MILIFNDVTKNTYFIAYLFSVLILKDLLFSQNVLMSYIMIDEENCSTTF